VFQMHFGFVCCEQVGSIHVERIATDAGVDTKKILKDDQMSQHIMVTIYHEIFVVFCESLEIPQNVDDAVLLRRPKTNVAKQSESVAVHSRTTKTV
jgi:hypothetical protein